MTTVDTEVPILPRRLGTSPVSSEVLTVQYGGWHPQRSPYQGFGGGGYYAAPYATGAIRGPLEGARNVSMALESIIQMLYSWTQMIDGTYYTWTTSLSMAISLWHRLSELLSKCRNLILGLLKWWLNFFRGKRHSSSLYASLEKRWDSRIINENGISGIQNGFFGGGGGLGIICLVLVLSVILLKKKHSSILEAPTEEDSSSMETDGNSNGPGENVEFTKLAPPIFAKVIHGFSSDKDGDFPSLEEGQLVAITQVPKSHALWNPEGTKQHLDIQLLSTQPTWLYGRTRNGKFGMFPSNYISIIDTQASA